MAKAKVGKTEKPKKEETVIVETIKAKAVETPTEDVISERVSGGHKVNFKPNGSNPRLGYSTKKVAATTAQHFVDKGWGNVVK